VTAHFEMWGTGVDITVAISLSVWSQGGQSDSDALITCAAHTYNIFSEMVKVQAIMFVFCGHDVSHNTYNLRKRTEGVYSARGIRHLVQGLLIETYILSISSPATRKPKKIKD
jgi:hypothetical protein